MSCSTSNLGPGLSTSFEIVTDVDPAIELGELTNTASVDADESEPVEAGITVPVVGNDATLTVTKTTPETDALAGATIPWTITVRNDGPDAVTVPIEVTDDLSDDLEFVAIGSASGLDCSVADGEVRCSVDQLAVGAEVSVVVETRATRTGEVRNVATVLAHGVVPASGVIAAADTTVTAPPPLLAFTGGSTGVALVAAFVLLALGAGLLVVGRRRSTGTRA